MCQMLGMNSNTQAAITFSFEGFSARGGKTDEHRDGWGIAFFEASGCRVFIDPCASVDSQLAELIKRYPIKSRNTIAHIRKATHGEIALNNCHPFMRELWGQYWIFCHNGDLKDFHPQLNGLYTPVGTTDSEYAFCYLLQEVRKRFSSAPSLPQLTRALREITAEIGAHGSFNYLLSNGDALFAHCSTNLHYVARQAPFCTAQLVDCDMSMDLSAHNGPDDRIIIVATQPLTRNEPWVAFEANELKVFIDGQVATIADSEPPVASTVTDGAATPALGKLRLSV